MHTISQAASNTDLPIPITGRCMCRVQRKPTQPDPAALRTLAGRLDEAGNPDLGKSLRDLASKIEQALENTKPTPGILPPDLADRLEHVLNPAIPQSSLGPINAVIQELGKYNGFEAQKAALEKRKMVLKQGGL